MVFSTAGFPPVSCEKRLDLKGLKGRTKAEEEGTRGPFLLSLRPPIKALQIEPFLTKNWWKTAEPRVHREGTDPLLNPICRIQPDTAVYKLSSTKFSSTSTFFFSLSHCETRVLWTTFLKNIREWKFHCRLFHGKIEIALVNHGWRLPCIKVLESGGKIPRTTAAWAWCASLVRVKSAASKFREQRCAHVEFYCSIGAPAVEPVFSKRCFSHGAPRDARARDFVNFRTL